MPKAWLLLGRLALCERGSAPPVEASARFASAAGTPVHVSLCASMLARLVVKAKAGVLQVPASKKHWLL